MGGPEYSNELSAYEPCMIWCTRDGAGGASVVQPRLQRSKRWQVKTTLSKLRVGYAFDVWFETPSVPTASMNRDKYCQTGTQPCSVPRLRKMRKTMQDGRGRWWDFHPLAMPRE
ncbi:hypothetical protein AA313_de0204021 [Arthrobotrys entomopaga]|nr:hypothetical protein AA313_de0204021 [Arthrobotrys entomopaga]